MLYSVCTYHQYSFISYIMTTYTCPMHPEIKQDHPGKCPKCGGMELVPEEELQNKSDGGLMKYKPLFIIIGLIAFVAVVTSLEANTVVWNTFAMHFMAGFFLVFSGFKLLDVKGFAEGYSTYDLLAKRVPAYGFVYPFIELALGTVYAMGSVSKNILIVTLILMLFSGLGVAMAMARKQKFQCACLGTFIDVPLTNITLIEDFGMAAMAAWMLLG